MFQIKLKIIIFQINPNNFLPFSSFIDRKTNIKTTFKPPTRWESAT